MEDPGKAPKDTHSSGTGRRRILVRATGVVGGVAALGAASPFLATLAPNGKTKAQGAPVTTSLTEVALGALSVVPWRRRPVWIMRRTPEMIEQVSAPAPELTDPDSESSIQPEYCRNKTRSIKPEVFVALGICTHLGCSPALKKPDGFLCACHGSNFDFAGRVFKGSPAPTNLTIPPHRFLSDDEIVIGEDHEAA